jgi:ATP-binding protein involved in chromosome partitioning
MIERVKIAGALGKVTDPETGRSLMAMNRVQDLEIDGNNVNFTIVLPSLNKEYKSQLNFACIGAIQEIYPSADVNIHVKSTAPGAQATTSPKPHIKNVIAVASGKGGVGKSTVAVNLALSLKAQGATVGVLDADLYGPSIPTMFGLQGSRPKVENLYGKPSIKPLEAHGIYLISMGFIIEPEQAVVLRGPRLGGIIKQFVNDVVWPPLDYLIIDLPPGTGDVQLSLVQTIPVTGAVMVTTPQEVAFVDAIKAMNMFRLPSVNVPILGVVENMAWFTPEELPDNKYYIFGQGGGKRLAKASNSMLLGQVPLVQTVREGGDDGMPIVLKDQGIIKDAFTQIALNTMRQVNLRNEMLAPTTIVKMQS